MSPTEQSTDNVRTDASFTETVFSSPAGARPVPPLPRQPVLLDPLDMAKRRAVQPGPGAPKDKAGGPLYEPEGTADAQVANSSAHAPSDILDELHQIMRAGELAQGSTVSKADLAMFLERFAQVLRGDREPVEIKLAPRADEFVQMKDLLLEAQETIIKLLHDRVYDRAKIAHLEAEVRLMPDLQAQATRAMRLALRSEDFAKELEHVREDVGQLRKSYLRAEPQPAWWHKILNLGR